MHVLYCFLLASASTLSNAIISPGWTLEYPGPRYNADRSDPPTFPCGGIGSTFNNTGARTGVVAYGFPLSFSFDNGSYDISVLATVSTSPGAVFDAVIQPTFRLDISGNGSFCLPSVDLTTAFGYSPTQHYATLQIIIEGASNNVDYACADVEFFNGLPSSGVTCNNATLVQTQIVATGLLANGSTPVNPTTVSTGGGLTTNTPGFTQGGNNSASSSSGLGTSTIVGIVVGVVIAVIIIIATLYCCRRHQKRKAAAKKEIRPEEPSSPKEPKPELQGGPFDPSIAGPVKPKAELLSQSSTRSELPQGWPEMPGQPGVHAHELSAGALLPKRKPVGGGSQISGSTATATTVVASSTSGTQARAPAQGEYLINDADLVAEADDLVQELGLIANRKKRLETAATTRGVKADGVEGSKGEDYRELVRRESRLRRRMDEIQQERGGLG